MGVLENKFKARTRQEIKKLLPGCVLIDNDPDRFQGIPDLLILWRNKWGMLEFKKSADYDTEPNQPYWVSEFNQMSFAAFIYPENKDQVLDDLQQTFRARR